MNKFSISFVYILILIILFLTLYSALELANLAGGFEFWGVMAFISICLVLFVRAFTRGGKGRNWKR